MKRTKRRIEVGLWIVGAGLVLWPALGLVWLPARYWSQRAYGGVDAQCTLDRVAFSEAREHARIVESAARASASRVIQTEGDLLLWHTPAGSFWIPQGSSRELAQALAGRLMFPRWQTIEGYGEPPVRPGDVVIDCGAHVGQSTLTALRMGARLVVSVEPDPKNLMCLRRNLAEHIAAGRVIVAPVGVSDRDAMLPIVRGAESSQTEVLQEGHEGEHEAGGDVMVPLTTIDALVAKYQLERVDFIKMDIEGAEMSAVRGAAQTLRRFRPRMALATYHTPQDIAGGPREVGAIRSDYQIQPSRCLRWGRRVIPNILFFF